MQLTINLFNYLRKYLEVVQVEFDYWSESIGLAFMTFITTQAVSPKQTSINEPKPMSAYIASGSTCNLLILQLPKISKVFEMKNTINPLLK